MSIESKQKQALTRAERNEKKPIARCALNKIIQDMNTLNTHPNVSKHQAINLAAQITQSIIKQAKKV